MLDASRAELAVTWTGTHARHHRLPLSKPVPSQQGDRCSNGSCSPLC
jgi:hypothetical protein